jgi:hypothetical protein
MTDLRARIASRAFETLAGASYHRYRETALSGPFYEIPLRETTPWTEITERVWPELARWLEIRRIAAEDPRGVVLAIFVGDTCYLVRAEAFRDLFCEVEGLNRSAFHFRVRQWLAR